MNGYRDAVEVLAYKRQGRWTIARKSRVKLGLDTCSSGKHGTKGLYSAVHETGLPMMMMGGGENQNSNRSLILI